MSTKINANEMMDLATKAMGGDSDARARLQAAGFATNTSTTIDTIKRIRQHSEASWELCVSTAGIAHCGDSHDQEREDKARRAADAADEAWDRAIDAIDTSYLTAEEIEAAREALEEARQLASEWGDDSEERRAIELLDKLTPEPTRYACRCGECDIGERCAWQGPVEELVVVEYMPVYLRSSHTAARNSGCYPANGAIRVAVEESCAERLLEDNADAPDGCEWCVRVAGVNVSQYAEKARD